MGCKALYKKEIELKKSLSSFDDRLLTFDAFAKIND